MDHSNGDSRHRFIMALTSPFWVVVPVAIVCGIYGWMVNRITIAEKEQARLSSQMLTKDQEIKRLQQELVRLRAEVAKLQELDFSLEIEDLE